MKNYCILAAFIFAVYLDGMLAVYYGRLSIALLLALVIGGGIYYLSVVTSNEQEEEDEEDEETVA